MAQLIDPNRAVVREIMDATYGIWNEGLDRQAYDRYYAAQIATLWGRGRLTRTALVDGDRLLASAKEYRLDAVLDGRPIRVLGIGAVFTQPEHRGRGHARDLLGRLLERASAAGVDLALLFSEIGA